MSPVLVGPGDWGTAVADPDGPQLVLAGPGTGKTEFLARRAAHLIESRLVRPDELLVLTFSRRAANELRTRIEASVGRSMLEVPASTFHSYCYRLLEYGGTEVLPWTRLPTILTGPEQVLLIGRLLSTEDPSGWPQGLRPLLRSRTLAEEVTEFVLRSRERLLWGPSLAEVVRGRADWRALPAFMERYDDEMVRAGRIDYGTLQAATVRALENPSHSVAAAARPLYVLVDEFQDTTLAQARLLELLSDRTGNLTVAADPWQSIYGFRGAAPENVAAFTSRFEGAKQLLLGTSFRVPAEILAAAGRVRSEDSSSFPEPPVLPAPHVGAVAVIVFDQHSHEADWIASEVQRLHVSDGIPYRNMAVLLRSKRRFLGEMARALARRRIPHDEQYGRLADHPAVQIILDCVKVVQLEHAASSTSGEDSLALRREADRVADRILLGPLFRLPLGTRREAMTARIRDEHSWAEIVAEMVPGGAGLAALFGNRAWIEEPADEGFWTWWTTLPQIPPLVLNQAQREARAAWSSLAQTLHRLVERDPAITLAMYADLAESEDYEATPLLSLRTSDEDRVVLTTLHQAKGLEFDVVFIADAVEGVFPDLRRERSILRPHLLGSETPTTPAKATSMRLAEEARLAYVGMTRARYRVVWTATSAGIEETQLRPSRFMRLAAGIGETESLPGPPVDTDTPVTVQGLEANLRRQLRDPEREPARRLATASLLASSPRLRHPLDYAGVRARGPDRGVMPEAARLSPSQADLYDRCPRRYVLVRRLGLGDEENVYARFGSLIHEVLEAVERRAMERGVEHATLEEALEELDRHVVGYDFGWRGTSLAWRRRGVELLTNLYQNWPSPPGCIPIDVERRLELVIADAPWVGFADRVERRPDGGLRIVDYKTSKTKPKDLEVSLQLAFYALAASADPGLDGSVVEAELWYPLAGIGKRGVAHLQLAQLPDLEERLVGISLAIRAEEWSPRPGAHCERCPVRALCPAWMEGREAFVS